MICKSLKMAVAALALGIACVPAVAQQFGPPATGNTSALLFVPATVNLVAGFNGAGYADNGGLANSSMTQLNYPAGIAFDSNGNLFFAEVDNYVVRRIDHITGDITTFAGNHNFPSGQALPTLTATTQATSVALGQLWGLVIDSSNNVYVSDQHYSVVWKVTPSGVISVFAGTGVSGFGGDGGPATSANFQSPFGLGIDSQNNIYVADTGNDLIRKINAASPNDISTFAGDTADVNELACPANPYSATTPPFTATEIHLCYPFGIAFDSRGNAFVSDDHNMVIREVAADGTASILAGTYQVSGYSGDGAAATSATLRFPAGVYVDSANRVYFSDDNGQVIRVVDGSGNINTIYGNSAGGSFLPAIIGQPDTEPVANYYPAEGIVNLVMDQTGTLFATNGSGETITSAGSTGRYIFPETAVFTTSAVKYITIENPSGVELNFAGVPTVTGPYTLVTGASAGTCNFSSSLAPGATCTIGLTFFPTVDNASTTAGNPGSIVITSNSNTSPNTITLSGASNGTPLYTATLTSSLGFSSPQSITSASQSVTLTNTGTPPLTISSAAFASGGAEFAVANTTCPTSPATLASGATCVYNITFTPPAVFFYTGQFQVTVAGFGTLSTNLSGTGTVNTPTDSLSPSLLSFGGVVDGQTSSPMVATLSNTGTATANITSIAIAGTNPSDFAIGTGANACGSSLGAGMTCGIYVTFTPAQATVLPASLQVTDNATGSPHTISLTGMGVVFASNVGTAEVAQTLTVTISTMGTLQSIEALSQGISGLDFALGSGGACATGTTYAVGQTCTVNVIFTPQYAGVRAGAIVLTDASGSVLSTTYISGIGTGPQIAFTPATQSNTIPATTYNPDGVAVDASGNIYIADGVHNTVSKFPKNGSGYGAPVSIGSGYNEPVGVAVDGAGNVYVGNYAGLDIVKIPWNGSSYGTQTTVPLMGSRPEYQPKHLTVDGFGNIYWIDYTQGGVVEEIPWTGTGYGPIVLLPFTNLNSPNGVAVDQNGDVFVADTYAYNVVMLPKASSGFGTQVTVTSGLTGMPVGIALDPRGDVFIADQENNALKGEALLEVPFAAGTYGAPINIPVTGLAGIQDVAIDGVGNIYAADFTNEQVFKLDTADAPSVTFATTNVGSTSSDSPKIIAVTNIGNASLTLSSGTNPSFPASFPANSSGSSLCVSGGLLTSGSSCNVSINFTPAASGALSGSVVLTDNNLNMSGATQSISVSGTGVSSLTAQAIIFTQPATPVVYSSGLTIPLSATGGASGNPVVFTLDGSSTGAGSVSGTTLTVTGVGSFVIDANQAGNSTYSAAPQVQRTVVVTQASQTITFTQPTTPVTYTSGLTIPLSATGGASGNAVTFSIDASSTASGSVSGATLTVTGTGTLVIDANQAGNANYSAATQAQRTVAVNAPGAQAITFTQPATPVVYASGLSIPLAATGGASGNPVVFTLDAISNGAGSISGTTLTVTGVGTFVVDANQAGNASYTAAPQVQRSVVVTQAPQAIAFTQPNSPVTFASGLTVSLSATGGASGNAVVFTIDSSSTGTGSISGGTLTVTGAGNIVIDANQAGNANYSAAAQVQKTVVVNVPAPDFGVASTTPSQSIAHGASAMFTINVTDSGSAFTSPVTLSVTGLPTGATGTFNPPTVTPGSSSGTSTLTVQLPAQTAMNHGSDSSARLVLAGIPAIASLLSLVLLLPVRRARKLWRNLLLALVAIGALGATAALSGCGGGFALTNSSQTYTLTVTGTSGEDTHSTTVQLTVQ